MCTRTPQKWREICGRECQNRPKIRAPKSASGSPATCRMAESSGSHEVREFMRRLNSLYDSLKRMIPPVRPEARAHKRRKGGKRERMKPPRAGKLSSMDKPPVSPLDAYYHRCSLDNDEIILSVVHQTPESKAAPLAVGPSPPPTLTPTPLTGPGGAATAQLRAWHPPTGNSAHSCSGSRLEHTGLCDESLPSTDPGGTRSELRPYGLEDRRRLVRELRGLVDARQHCLTREARRCCERLARFSEKAHSSASALPSYLATLCACALGAVVTLLSTLPAPVGTSATNTVDGTGISPIIGLDDLTALASVSPLLVEHLLAEPSSEA